MVKYNLNSQSYSTFQLTSLVVLRILIGWHFLNEGISKLLNPYWTSSAFLNESQWIFAGIFKWMAATPAILNIVDILNIWGQIFIGIGLIAGFFTRTACLSGAVLLFLYYLCWPPLIGFSYSAPQEVNYLFVDKNLIEMTALVVLFLFNSGHIIGVDRFILLRKQRKVIQ
ncbi:MAG TPA: DoxX family protein [bacterium]|nr:DoxX family protein [bacterium]